MRDNIDNTLKDEDVIELGVASIETKGDPGMTEGHGESFLPVISEE
jgi:hypothetical protein